MPNKELLLKFANLKLKQKAIENEIELIKLEVQTEVEALIGPDVEQIALEELPGCSLSLAKARPKWEYSKFTQDSDAALKERKKEEEQTGEAVNLNDGKRELRFNQAKE